MRPRREDAPWARAFGLYLRIGLVIVVLRVLLRIVFAGDTGTTVLFTLPELPLPGWFAGVGVGGPVTAEALVAAFVDGLRLATILICFGAANCLANPKRLLRLLPNALYEIGAAVTVALSVAPQLAESVGPRPEGAAAARWRVRPASRPASRSWPMLSTARSHSPPPWTRVATAGAARSRQDVDA